MNSAAGPTSPRPSGRIDGRYTIVSRLGKGSMGVVYRARDEQIGRDVAVKVMMADTEGEVVAVERFRREARAMGRLLHRNVVTVYNMGESSGRHYIVMELLEGCTLSEWMKEEAHPLEDQLDLMLQTCDGLAVAHSAGIIHRDVKPNNLFVHGGGTLKIVDFGIARLASSNMTRSGLVLGTPHYMSPEQARGAEVDERSDVFSAAAVFYQMLSGRKPFEGDDLPVVLHRVANSEPPPLSDAEAPSALARIITKGLRKAVEERYQSVTAMATDLARFKRQFEGDTRRLFTAAEQRFAELRRTAADLATLRTTLALAGTSPTDAVLAKVLAFYPVLDHAPTGKPRILPERRDAVQAIEAAVTDVARVVDKEGNRLSSLQAAIAAGERALEAREPQRALESLQSGVPWLQGDACPALQALVVRAKTLLADQMANADYLKSLLDRGHEAEASGQWTLAVRCANDALAVSPQSGDARALLTRSNQALSDASAAKARRSRRLHEQADAALEAGHFEQVDQLIGLITDIDASDARLPDLLTRVDASHQAEAKRAADVRAAAEVLASTRASFAAGRRDDAIAELDAFVRRYPGVPVVADQLRRFRDEASRVAAVDARSSEVQALMVRAQNALGDGDLDGGEQLVARILALAPGLAAAGQLQQRLHDKRLELEQGLARREQAAAFARKAVVAMARGNYDRAESEARRALELDPNRGDAAVVVVDVPNLVLAERREVERRRVEAERARAADELVREAHSLLNSGEFQRAVDAAERASQIDASRGGVAAVLAQTRAVIAAVRAGGWEAERPADVVPREAGHGRSSSVRRIAEGARDWLSSSMRSKR